MFGPEYCFPFRLDGDAPQRSVIGTLVEAARRHGAAIRIESSSGNEASARAVTEICQQADDGTTVGLLARLGVVEGLLDGPLPHIITVSVDGADTYDSVARVAEAILRHEHVLELYLPETSRFTAEQLDELGAWRVLGPDDTRYRLRGGEVAMAASGHIVRCDSTGQRRHSEAPVQDVGFDAALASVELDISALLLLDGSLYLPMVFRIPEPGGCGRVAYWSGGTQGYAHYLAQEEARAALGFHSDERAEYEEWLNSVAGITADADPFPAFAWNRLDYGLMVSDGEETFVPPPARDSGKHPALVFAAWLASGQVDEVAYCLGVRSELPYYADGRKLAVADLTQAARKQLAARAPALLALAVQILAMSRLRDDKRTAVAAVLPTLATHDARRAAEQLAQTVPEIGNRVLRKFSNRATRSRIRKGRDPAVTLRHLEQAMAQLAEVFGGQGDRHG